MLTDELASDLDGSLTLVSNYFDAKNLLNGIWNIGSEAHLYILWLGIDNHVELRLINFNIILSYYIHRFISPSLRSSFLSCDLRIIECTTKTIAREFRKEGNQMKVKDTKGQGNEYLFKFASNSMRPLQILTIKYKKNFKGTNSFKKKSSKYVTSSPKS